MLKCCDSIVNYVHQLCFRLSFALSCSDHAYTPLSASVKENAMVFYTGFLPSLILYDKFILLKQYLL